MINQSWGSLCIGLAAIAASATTPASDAALSLDSSFGAGGVAAVDLGSSYDVGDAIYAASDDSIYVLGVTRGDASESFVTKDTVVAHVLANGQLDPAYGSNGRVTLALGNTDTYTALAVDATGRALLARCNSSYAEVMRLRADGGVDSTFGANGTARLATDAGSGSCQGIGATRVDTDGHILVFGSRRSSSSDPIFLFVARFTAAGAADSSFTDQTGKSGIRYYGNYVAANQYANAMAVTDSGEIYFGGGDVTRIGDSSGNSAFLHGYFANNSIIFDVAGYYSGQYSTVLAIAPQARGIVNALIGVPSGDSTPPEVAVVERDFSGSTELSRQPITSVPAATLRPRAVIDAEGRVTMLAEPTSESATRGDVLLARYAALDTLVTAHSTGGTAGGSTAGGNADGSGGSGGGAMPSGLLLIAGAQVVTIIVRRRRRPPPAP